MVESRDCGRDSGLLPLRLENVSYGFRIKHKGCVFRLYASDYQMLEFVN